jgi:TetR/AcrR family transcriptional repressor of mexCD-oprJ operon
MSYEILASLSARARLLQAAAVVWAANPSAPLDAVARAAGVGRATLHRYFASRADLMRAAALEGIGALAAALAAAELPTRPPAEALAALIDLLVPFGERLHFLLVTGDLIGDDDVAAAEATVDAPIRQVLEAAVSAGLLRTDVPAAWRFRALEALLYAAWTAVAGGELARNDAPALVRDAFHRGFGVDAS